MKRAYVYGLIALLVIVAWWSVSTAGGSTGGGGGGGLPRYCQVTVTISGVYNSFSPVIGVSANYFSNFLMSASEGACFPFPTTLSSLDLFPTQIPWTVTATGTTGAPTNAGTISVPAVTLTFPFTLTTTFSLTPGTYTITWSSPVAQGICVINCQLTQKTTITVT